MVTTSVLSVHPGEGAHLWEGPTPALQEANLPENHDWMPLTVQPLLEQSPRPNQGYGFGVESHLSVEDWELQEGHSEGRGSEK